MDFLDETHTTRWASVCVFSNILLILLAIACDVLKSSLGTNHVTLLLPQTLLIAPLLLQLICLAVFTFSARSGALQLFKYQLQIPFLGRWMLPVIVLTLSLICVGALSRALITTGPEEYRIFFIIITLLQLTLHGLHLLNLTWGFIHYLWTSRPRHYQPIHQSKKATEINPDVRSSTSSGHLSKAYLRLSERKGQPRYQGKRITQNAIDNGPTSHANYSSDIDSSNDVDQIQVTNYDTSPPRLKS